MHSKWRSFWRVGLLVILVAFLAACNGGNAANNNSGADNQVAPTATLEIPADVPMMDGAEALRVSSNGTQINYEVVAPFDDAVKYYQEQLVSLGWEQQSKKDSGFANNITLLRNNAEYNLSVTIQTIAGSDTLRISITRLPK